MKLVSAILRFLIVGFILWCILAVVCNMLSLTTDRQALPLIGVGWLLAAYDAWRWYRNETAPPPDRTRCPRCGYDLRATPDRCPECGQIPPR